MIPNLDKSVEAKIKVVSEKCKVIENAQTYDLSLKESGPIEDKTYAENPSLLENLRRGNTFISIDGGEKQILRKGLPKFFDLKPIYVESQVKSIVYEEENS